MYYQFGRFLMTPWFAAPPFFHLLDFSFKETYRFIRFEKDSRYYSMCIENDLLDDWIIVITNGRIKTKLGQTRKFAFTSYSDAFDYFCEVIQVRLKRHYKLTSFLGDDPLLINIMVYAPTVQKDILSNTAQPTLTKKPRQTKVRVPNTFHSSPIQMGFLF